MELFARAQTTNLNPNDNEIVGAFFSFSINAIEGSGPGCSRITTIQKTSYKLSITTDDVSQNSRDARSISIEYNGKKKME